MRTGFPQDTPGARLAGLREQVETRLAQLLPPAPAEPLSVAAAMHAAVLPGGKRLRPLLLLAAGQALGAPVPALLDLACSLEMVHCASLVLDDMPAMDNARLRRGQPTVHVRFGEDVALLATVGLVSEACRVAATAPGLRAAARARSVQVVCQAIGPLGLVRGQYRDLRPEAISVAGVAEANDQKTGVLFAAALELAARAAGASAQVAALRRGGFALGQAFQLRDDLEDIAPDDTGLEERGQDAGKPTLVHLLGASAVHRKMEAELGRAVAGLLPVLARDDTLVLELLRRAFPESRPAASPATRHAAASAGRTPRWRGNSGWAARAA